MVRFDDSTGARFSWACLAWLAGIGFLEMSSLSAAEPDFSYHSGENDGILRAWIDGRLAFEKTDVRMRTVDDLKIEAVWLNVHPGGKGTARSEPHLSVDEIAISERPTGTHDAGQAQGDDPIPVSSRYAAWEHGPSTDPEYFPIAVWLQNPRNASRYQAAGINVYVGLWRGPTQAQLDALKEAGMQVVCAQNDVGLRNVESDTIIAWMHDDEPDNAQSLGEGNGYGPPVAPEVIKGKYMAMHRADPTRPVLLNLGQGVAYDNYIGRGVRRNHPEDYPEYLEGCDIASFDIYPVVHRNAEVAGRLEFVANGVKRLVRWTEGDKPVWNCIECTRISNTEVKPSPAQVHAEVWMSLIHGSRGLIYFVHQFEPTFQEAALLDDPEMLEAVTEINRQIHQLAPVLNSPITLNDVSVESESNDVPVAMVAKRHGEAVYLFAVAMRNKPVQARFSVPGFSDEQPVVVLDENRELTLRDGTFRDEFDGYEVHLYRIGD